MTNSVFSFGIWHLAFGILFPFGILFALSAGPA